MSDDNGTGNGGGNGSVWWGMQHGSQRKGVRAPQLAQVDLDGPPGPGRVKLGRMRAEGHDETPFDEIGRPDHPGMFRVRLRFRKADLESKAYTMSAQQREMIRLFAKPMPKLADDSVFLEIDVPAIKRDPPAKGDDWQSMPWEIHWEW
jgi:hypothetical protein